MRKFLAALFLTFSGYVLAGPIVRLDGESSYYGGNKTIGNNLAVNGVISGILSGVSTGYIQNTSSLQSSSTFYVSSGTVVGRFESLGPLFTSSATSYGTVTSTAGFVGVGSSLTSLNGSNISSGLVGGSFLAGNSTSYIQNSPTLQASSTFYVSSGTVRERFESLGPLFASSATSYGTVTSTTGFVGVGSSLTSLTPGNVSNGNLPPGVVAIGLAGGSTSYIQNTATLQSSSTFYVSSGTIDGQAILARSSGGVGISSSTPGNIFVVGAGTATFGVVNSGNTQGIIVGGPESTRTQPFNVGDPDVTFSGNAPHLLFQETGVTANNTLWNFVVDAEQLAGTLMSDGLASGQSWITVDRTGTTMDFVNFPNGNVGISSATPVARLAIGGANGFRLGSDSNPRANVTPATPGILIFHSGINAVCLSTGNVLSSWALLSSTGTICN